MKKDLNKSLPFLVFFLAASFLFIFPLAARAQDVNNLMENLIVNTPVLRADLLTIIFNVIRYVLAFLGVMAVVILIYGGFVWMTARGNDEQVRKAKKIIANGLIGLVIILLSYAIVSFVVNTLSRTGGIGGGGEPGGGGPGGFPNGRSFLVIIDRKPKPDETTPRNTKVSIVFNQSLDSATVKLARPKPGDPKNTDCTDWNVAIQNVNGDFIDGSLKVVGDSLIFTPRSESPDYCPSGYPDPNFVCKVDTEDVCFLYFKNPGCCGCFKDGKNYKISLIAYRGTQYVGIKGTRGNTNKLYKSEIWKFHVADYIDTQKPEVETNLPQGENVARNVGILVKFTKAIDLSTLTLYNPDCDPDPAGCDEKICNTRNRACLGYAVNDIAKASVKVLGPDGPDPDSDPDPIPGFFESFLTDTFLFRPSERCESPNNQCRCFPKLTPIEVKLVNEGDYGIKDINCNYLDCPNCPGPNCKCNWTFTTSNQVDIEPPKVKSTDPIDKAEDVDRLLKIEAVFDEASGMDATSVNEDTFVLWPFVSPREIKTDFNTSTLTPSKILEPDTQYSPIIYGGGQPGENACNLDPDYAFGVKDLAGNAMVGNYLWNFKTGWMVNGGDPYIDWVDPKQGPKGDCVTVHGYNLGCCGPYDCSNDKEAQEKKWDVKQKVCSSATNGGQSFMWDQSNYIPAESLIWQEINKPEICDPGVNCQKNCCPKRPKYPKDCLGDTCSADPDKCLEGNPPTKVCYFCSDTLANCEIKHPECWCPMPLGYSQENELIIVVPPGANKGEDPNKIKVIPAY